MIYSAGQPVKAVYTKNGKFCLAVYVPAHGVRSLVYPASLYVEGGSGGGYTAFNVNAMSLSSGTVYAPSSSWYLPKIVNVSDKFYTPGYQWSISDGNNSPLFSPADGLQKNLEIHIAFRVYNSYAFSFTTLGGYSFNPNWNGASNMNFGRAFDVNGGYTNLAYSYTYTLPLGCYLCPLAFAAYSWLNSMSVDQIAVQIQVV